MISIELREFDLPNGMHVIMSPDKTGSVVAVDVWYHVGSKNEEPARTGFAHLFEHMMFQGSSHVAKAGHMKHVERVGGTFNGSTTWDRTNYYETLPCNQLELALWLESDRMMSLDISPDNLNNQREVVKEERRFRVDNKPYGKAWEKIFSLAYKEHPYRWPVVGYMEHLDAASVDDARAFFAKYYAPNNAVLTIAGNFKPEEARPLVMKYFNEIGSASLQESKPTVESPLSGPVREVVYDNVALPAVYIVYRTPPMCSPDSDSLNLAAALLSRGKSSRLYRKMVYEKKIAQSVNAFQVDMEDPGVFVVSAVVSPGHSPEEVEAEIRKEIGRLSVHHPSSDEMAKIKNQFTADWLRQLSRAIGRADMLAHFRTFFGDARRMNDYPAGILSVSGGRISQVTDTYLDTENVVVVYYLPGGDKAAVD